MVTLSDDPAEQVWVATYPNVTTVDLSQEAMPPTAAADGWSQFLERTLAGGHVPFLVAETARPRPELSLDDLPALGLQLLESLDGLECRRDSETDETKETAPAASGGPAHAAHPAIRQEHAGGRGENDGRTVGHAGHGSAGSHREVGDLDDLVFDAIAGQSSAMEQLQIVWPRLLKELGDSTLAESREQYLRYALSLWQESTDADGIRNPVRTHQALDVLCLLFGDAP